MLVSHTRDSRFKHSYLLEKMSTNSVESVNSTDLISKNPNEFA